MTLLAALPVLTDMLPLPTPFRGCRLWCLCSHASASTGPAGPLPRPGAAGPQAVPVVSDRAGDTVPGRRQRL